MRQRLVATWAGLRNSSGPVRPPASRLPLRHVVVRSGSSCGQRGGAARYKMPSVGATSRVVEGRPPTAGLLAAAVLVVTVAGYNVDVSVPVVKYGPRPTSYFGFSVAQHGVWQRHSNRSLPV